MSRGHRIADNTGDLIQGRGSPRGRIAHDESSWWKPGLLQGGHIVVQRDGGGKRERRPQLAAQGRPEFGGVPGEFALQGQERDRVCLQL